MDKPRKFAWFLSALVQLMWWGVVKSLGVFPCGPKIQRLINQKLLLGFPRFHH
jgi:hypothetical protein